MFVAGISTSLPFEQVCTSLLIISGFYPIRAGEPIDLIQIVEYLKFFCIIRGPGPWYYEMHET
jgi:hypothetical protein